MYVCISCVNANGTQKQHQECTLLLLLSAGYCCYSCTENCRKCHEVKPKTPQAALVVKYLKKATDGATERGREIQRGKCIQTAKAVAIATTVLKKILVLIHKSFSECYSLALLVIFIRFFFG